MDSLSGVDHSHRTRFMGVDLGSKRIGIALSDLNGILASPHVTLERASKTSVVFDQLINIAKAEEVSEIVIGLPNSLSAKNTIERERTLAFIEEFKVQTSLPIHLVDERFTTVLAQKRMREIGRNAKTMKGHVDAVAAAEILQSFLDGRGH